MLYSISIQPSQEAIKEARRLKLQLREKFGRFPGSNLDIQIGLCEFEDDGSLLDQWQQRLERFAASQEAFSVTFNRLDMFGGGGIYLAPEKHSAARLHEAMSRFHRHTAGLPSWKANLPHMAIVKKLNPFHNEAAARLFSSLKFEISFECTQLCLRTFNPDRNQFETRQLFPLKRQSQPVSTAGQIALF